MPTYTASIIPHLAPDAPTPKLPTMSWVNLSHPDPRTLSAGEVRSVSLGPPPKASPVKPTILGVRAT